MAKFCLLAERILPNCLQKWMIVEKERVVCLHGMCKVPMHIYILKTHVEAIEKTTRVNMKVLQSRNKRRTLEKRMHST